MYIILHLVNTPKKACMWNRILLSFHRIDKNKQRKKNRLWPFRNAAWHANSIFCKPLITFLNNKITFIMFIIYSIRLFFAHFYLSLHCACTIDCQIVWCRHTYTRFNKNLEMIIILFNTSLQQRPWTAAPVLLFYYSWLDFRTRINILHISALSIGQILCDVNISLIIIPFIDTVRMKISTLTRMQTATHAFQYDLHSS